MDEFKIREYKNEDELNWLDLHASLMVDSYAWWTVIHKKPHYKNDIIDLVIQKDKALVGLITTEINSGVIDFVDNDYGFVWEFGVHRDYRGLGLGKKLIDKTHKILGDKYSIYQSIWFSQDENSQRYYKKLGMEEIERHYQFSIKPDDDLNKKLIKKGFKCWSMRGECKVDDYKKVKKNFKIINDDDALKPRLCIGYRYINDNKDDDIE